MSTEPNQDPCIIDQLGEIIGAVATLRMLALFGNTFLHIPKTMPETHVIARCIGLPAARKLSERFAGEKLAIPSGEQSFLRLVRVRRTAALLRAGTSPSDIALLIGLGRRQVRYYRVEAEELGLLPMVFERNKTE
jgi:hypothetical protein